MKRNFGWMLAVCAVLFTGWVAPAAAQAKLGYVNSQKVLAEAPGTAEAQRTLESDMERFRVELDSLGKQIETMRTDLERQQSTLSATARQQRQQQIQQKMETGQRRFAEVQQLMQRREAELMEPIMKRVSEAIEAVRKEGSYAMIFDTGSGIVAADPALNLTDRVLERLRATR